MSCMCDPSHPIFVYRGQNHHNMASAYDRLPQAVRRDHECIRSISLLFIIAARAVYRRPSLLHVPPLMTGSNTNSERDLVVRSIAHLCGRKQIVIAAVSSKNDANTFAIASNPDDSAQGADYQFEKRGRALYVIKSHELFWDEKGRTVEEVLKDPLGVKESVFIRC